MLGGERLIQHLRTRGLPQTPKEGIASKFGRWFLDEAGGWGDRSLLHLHLSPFRYSLSLYLALSCILPVAFLLNHVGLLTPCFNKI